MRINTVLIEYMQSQGANVRLIPDRDLSDYSWPELLGIHPDAQAEVAGLLGYKFISSIDEFNELYIPNLSPATGESDYDYDSRIEKYMENNYFPAKLESVIITDNAPTAISWICSNPFISNIDEYAGSQIVLMPIEVISNILRGTRSESSVVAPYSEHESIDTWINKLISAAYSQGAADVEITSHITSIKVRFKIMGEWSSWLSSIPLIQRGPLLRAICASASPSLDYESGVDHDFKLEKRIQGIDTSWRGSITPATLGDSVTLRMLPGIGRIPLLEDLGYDVKACDLLRKAKKRRDGLVLVTGSTGHGKTTTLYALITEMRDENKKVFTVEHPVELIIPGTIQKSVMDATNIDSKYRVTFPSAIRTALRHAPDVLVVGETRDTETAQTAVGASRTGHLTFTTLHTTNVRLSIKRMIDLGVDSLNLADTLCLVISQNLVRKLCPHCKIVHDDGTCSRKAGGCGQCSARGSLGRTVIYEMLSLDDDAREAIIDGRLEKEYSRLEKAGLYISKKSIATNLMKTGIIDVHDANEFINV